MNKQITKETKGLLRGLTRGDRETMGLKGIKKIGEFVEFGRFMATPEQLRFSIFEVKTQKEFGEKYGVCENMLGIWKNKEEFRELVVRLRENWGKEKTSDILGGLYKKAVRDGNASEVKLWLQYFEGFAEKTESRNLNLNANFDMPEFIKRMEKRRSEQDKDDKILVETKFKD
jgi:hypothetical protein